MTQTRGGAEDPDEFDPSWRSEVYRSVPAPQQTYGGPIAQRAPYEVGKVRSTGMCILLAIVTLGIYAWVWYYSVHAEMQRHRHSGIGGGVALILALFVPFVLAFLTPSEIGVMYEARGQRPPVTGVTGCWIFLPLIGGLIWFIKTNDALNDYWRSLGAV